MQLLLTFFQEYSLQNTGLYYVCISKSTNMNQSENVSGQRFIFQVALGATFELDKCTVKAKIERWVNI